MINDLPIAADQVRISAVAQVHAVKQPLQAVVTDIDEQHALVRIGTIGNLHCP